MTQNLSEAQWELIEDDLNNILTQTDSYKELRGALREWLEVYGNYESGYRVDKQEVLGLD